MSALPRRAFLAGLARAGFGAAALASIPSWAHEALAAAAAPGLIIRNDWPEHLETTLSALGRSARTPNDVFFARSHFPPPTIDLDAWRLEVAGLARTPLSLRLADLQAMPQVDATYTIECAGNGRALYRLPSTSGTQWQRGAVGTARWGGVRLYDVLERAGVASEAKHVWFEAADSAPMPTAPKFLRSIPIEKAMRDALLAYTMNGAPLPVRHGAPLRVIVPGWYGMASAKWLTRVRLEAAPSDNHFMVKGYHYNYPGDDPATAAPVEEMRIKSVITYPLDGARVPAGRVRAQGFAWAGGEGVARVELSSDGGASWRAAALVGEDAPGAWRPWTFELTPAPRARVTLMARATDGAGSAQPLEARANAGGYGNNSIHRIEFRALG